MKVIPKYQFGRIIKAATKAAVKEASKVAEKAVKKEMTKLIKLKSRIDRKYIKPTTRRSDISTREPLMDTSYDPNQIVNPRFNLTKGEVAEYWKTHGDLPINEQVAKGILRPVNINGQARYLVMKDGKPRGALDIYKGLKDEVVPKQSIPEAEIEETVEPLLTGEARRALLDKTWANAEELLGPIKLKHRIPTKTLEMENVSDLTLNKLIDRLFSQKGRIELPITWQELENNPELIKFVERVRKDGVPINPETGEPLIAVIDPEGNLVPTNRLASLLAYRTGENSKIGLKSRYTRDEPFIEGLRGTQPLLERETLLPNGEVIEGGTKVFGDLNFSTDRLLAALNYAEVLTHDLLLYVINALRARGYKIPKESVDYALSLVNNIRLKQIAKGIKLGGHNEEFRTGLRVPRSQYGEAGGVGDTDAKRLQGIWKSTEEPAESDWIDYINNMVRYNRFFGPKQGHGGVQAVLSRRPRWSWEKPIDMEGRRFGEPIPYKGKLYEDIHALETAFGNNPAFSGQDLINGRNPLLMRTIIAPRESYFYGWGLKKGGKLIKRLK